MNMLLICFKGVLRFRYWMVIERILEFCYRKGVWQFSYLFRFLNWRTLLVFLLLRLNCFLVMIHFWNKRSLWNDFGLVLWHVFRTRLNYDLQLLRSYIKEISYFSSISCLYINMLYGWVTIRVLYSLSFTADSYSIWAVLFV